MDSVNDRPPWSNKDLKRLGLSLLGRIDARRSGPSYADVMQWHSDLCGLVMAEIVDHDWQCCDYGMFDVSARAKTVDTLVAKLRRESPAYLNQVQDLAGVRIDIDCTLDIQSALARELTDLFGADSDAIHDLRETPHSGYRAIHVWLRLPAGRVEVQVRTRAQSEWANTYERLGDVVGRGIRYGQSHCDPDVQQIVAELHEGSRGLAHLEELEVTLVQLHIAEADSDGPRRLSELRGELLGAVANLKQSYVSTLQEAQANLDAWDER